jgi:hypothetical protein
MARLSEKYGSLALIAGASEGIGAAFADRLAAQGMDLVLVARRPEPLEAYAAQVRARHGVQVQCIACDLSAPDATQQIQSQLGDRPVNVLVYNAALNYIGRYEDGDPAHYQKLVQANCATPAVMAHAFGSQMVQAGRGAVILMASLAGFQGGAYIAPYAASKAFDRVLAEGLWYEWKARGVDVIACCAGATSTPGYNNTKPAKTNFLNPPVQTPEAVVDECLRHLGRRASHITGRGNRWANFLMVRLFPRSLAVRMISDTTRKMYGF